MKTLLNLLAAVILCGPCFPQDRVFEVACPSGSSDMQSPTINPSTGNYRSWLCVDALGRVTSPALGNVQGDGTANAGEVTLWLSADRLTRNAAFKWDFDGFHPANGFLLTVGAGAVKGFLKQWDVTTGMALPVPMVNLKAPASAPVARQLAIWDMVGDSGHYTQTGQAGVTVDADGTLRVPACVGCTAQVQTDWNAVAGMAKILNRPALATVATTGAYADLTGKPSIPNGQTGAAVGLGSDPTIFTIQQAWVETTTSWRSTASTAPSNNSQTTSLVAATATDPPVVRFVQTTASVNSYGFTWDATGGGGATSHPFGLVRRVVMRARIVGTTGVRYWFGVGFGVSGFGNTLWASDTPSGYYAMFRYSDGTDTTIKCAVGTDSTHQTVVDSTKAVDGNLHLFEIDFDGTTTVTFLIDGGQVGQISTNLIPVAQIVGLMGLEDNKNASHTATLDVERMVMVVL